MIENAKAFKIRGSPGGGNTISNNSRESGFYNCSGNLIWDVMRWMGVIAGTIPSKHGALTNAGLMLGRRSRRRANINPALGQCIVIARTTLINLHRFLAIYFG